MVKDNHVEGMGEGACDCECHRGSMKGVCDHFHGYCAWHVWRMLLIAAAFLFVFWIGLVCGEFRSFWVGHGNGLIPGYGMMGQYRYEQDEPAGSATDATSTTAQQ